MEGNTKQGHQLQRQLATLKLASRLLGHELHAQGGSKSITLSRDEVQEIQTTLELFIEEASRRMGSGREKQLVSAYSSVADTQLVSARN